LFTKSLLPGNAKYSPQENKEKIKQQVKELNLSLHQYEELIREKFLKSSVKYLLFTYWLKNKV